MQKFMKGEDSLFAVKRHDKEKGVLDELAESISDETLISDLSHVCRDEDLTSEAVEALTDIEPEKYRLSVWEDAAYYMTRIKRKFKSSSEVKRWLMEHLKHHH